MLNAISVDVEDYFHTEAASEVVPRDRWDSMPSRVVESTGAVLDLFAENNVRGTFFLLGWVANRFPALVREIAAKGHELACHSFWHRAVFRLDRKEFAEDTRTAKAAIEDAAGAPIFGYRAPSFSITPGTEWAFDVLAELGFSYDSSVHPIRHDFYSNAQASRVPYRTPSGLVEIPIATARLAGHNLPVGGGAYLRILPRAYVHWGLRRLNRVEHNPAMVYLHPWEIDAGQPRLALRTKSRLRQYTGLGRMQHKLQDTLSAFRFAPVAEAFSSYLESPRGNAAAAARA
jgi:polysaccharide deacetylase family protein (PEP-CTERM system associated)